jgi:2-polyprenyl-3-methyl-5-hydroxy-6-metoxy-1,4-benzoquinol methylase
MTALLTEYPPKAPVLDVGCGSGDLTTHLAANGFETVGIDFVEVAIAQAHSKKGMLAPEIADRLEFCVADALSLSRLEQTFGAVVDSGFYHLFDLDVCARFVDELALEGC